VNEATNPVSLYTEAIDCLRVDDLVSPILRLRQSTVELLDWLPEGVAGEELEGAFPELRSRLERCLAVAQPLLDFGGARGAGEVAWSLQSLALVQGDSANLAREPMASLAIHDLAWSLLADTLARGRLEVLETLAAVAIPNPYEGEATPILQDPNIRHTNVFNRGADRTYSSWREWLTSSELWESMSHFGGPPVLDAPLAEVELISAMCFAATRRDRAYCGSLGQGGGERLLRAHLRSASGRAGLAELFEVDEPDVAERLNELYALLGDGEGFGPRSPLIAT
jgi:hypothetical protein